MMAPTSVAHKFLDGSRASLHLLVGVKARVGEGFWNSVMNSCSVRETTGEKWYKRVMCGKKNDISEECE